MVQIVLLTIAFLMGFVLCAVFVVGRSADVALARAETPKETTSRDDGGESRLLGLTAR